MEEAAQVASFFCFMADFSIRTLSLPKTYCRFLFYGMIF